MKPVPRHVMKINFRHKTVLLFLLLVGNPLIAQTQSQMPFGQLPPQEQNLLKAGMNLWPQLDAGAQAQLRAQAQHWLTLSPAEQQTLLLKQRQWDGLSFSDKALERSRYAAWQSLGTRDQKKINAVYQQWRRLPVEKQQALKAKFSMQLPEYRQAWILGPALGRDAQSLNAWLLFIPQEQIRPWLMLLRELSAEQRVKLTGLGKRWNQQQRDTFRTRLLSAPAGARPGMIENASL